MARTGFIQNELDLKLLVLYIMSRTAAPVTFNQLLDVALCDAGVDYFSLTEVVGHLVETGHLEQTGQVYAITEKGLRVVRETTQTFDRFDQSMFEGVSEEEMHRFIQFAEKLQSNLQACKAEGEKNRS